MGLSDFFAGAAAAVIGGVVTAGGAWGASLLVERRRENLQLIGAITMLRAEVDENADRLEKDGHAGGLTLGVWEHCKPTLAGIGRRAISTGLWDDMHRAYRKIYEAKAGRACGDPEPVTIDELTSISTRLDNTSKAFEREPRLLRYWVRPEPNRRE